MQKSLYRTLRFTHPDFRLHETSIGLSLDHAGRLEMVDENMSVRQAILLLLTTIPGERVMRPDYGCDLYRLLFSPNDATTHGLAIHYIRSAIMRWETRIEILRLDAFCNEQNQAKMDIVLEYKVKRTVHKNTLVISLDMNDGA